MLVEYIGGKRGENHDSTSQELKVLHWGLSIAGMEWINTENPKCEALQNEHQWIMPMCELYVKRKVWINNNSIW